VSPASELYHWTSKLSSIPLLIGINLSVYYSTVIFSQVGLSSFLSQLLAAVMNTLFAAGTFFLPSTIERFGRRGIMMWSAVGLTICMTIFVAMISQPKPTLAMQWTAVASVIIYNFIFGYGWIGVCWLYGPEVSDTFHNILKRSLDAMYTY
jgi:MFS family permease